MQPSLDLQYCVWDLSFDDVAIFIVKWHELYISREDLVNLMSLNWLNQEMITEVLRLQYTDFSDLQYCIQNLSFDDVAIFIVKWHKLYISREDLVNLMSLNWLYLGMITEVLRLQYTDFSLL